MRIVVVSDTHRDFDRLYRLALAQRDQTDLFVHLGDGEQELDDLRAVLPTLPIRAVRGNCDLFSTAPERLIFEEAGVKILACHGHTLSVNSGLDRVRAFCHQNGIALALFGHTHRRCCLNEGALTLLNPGSLSEPRDSFRDSYGVVELVNGQPFCHLEQLAGN